MTSSDISSDSMTQAMLMLAMEDSNMGPMLLVYDSASVYAPIPKHLGPRVVL
jgi:hypothetical protein